MTISPQDLETYCEKILGGFRKFTIQRGNLSIVRETRYAWLFSSKLTMPIYMLDPVYQKYCEYSPQRITIPLHLLDPVYQKHLEHSPLFLWVLGMGLMCSLISIPKLHGMPLEMMDATTKILLLLAAAFFLLTLTMVRSVKSYVVKTKTGLPAFIIRIHGHNNPKLDAFLQRLAEAIEQRQRQVAAMNRTRDESF